MLLEITKTELTKIIASELNRLIPDTKIEGEMTKEDFMVLSDDVIESDKLSSMDDLDDITEFLDDEGVQICGISHISKIIAHSIYKN